ncbi:MAG TPA: alkaline phosphatase [Armatimonadota bacterium]|nr:alkaline phosphatase [Armatimonadota bacterium]
MNAHRTLRMLALLAVTAVLALAPCSADSAQPVADSAILFIGDGTGPMQIHLSREEPGQPLEMEKLPVAGIVTTNSVGGRVTDSAAAATALATGRKTENGMVGVAPDGQRLQSILERAQSMYKSAGIITTDSLHGATPASFAAHVDDRGKRSEIAAHMAASGADVMMGFWKEEFLPKSAGGEREDNRDLIAEMRAKGYEVVYNRDQLLNAKSDKLLGLFDDDGTEPSLAEMVTAAVDRLSRDPDGFFLVVEQARIDWECHDHHLPKAISYVRSLDKAVVAAVAAAEKRGRTLVVVTADHETGGLTPDGAFTTEDHTATPVRLFAFGPGAEAFTGDLDNTDVPKRIADAIGIGPFPD